MEATMPRTVSTPEDDRLGTRPAPYANQTSRRRVDLPSLINLLLGADAQPLEPASAHDHDDFAAAWLHPTTVDLSPASGRIDWALDPERLLRGDLDGLPPDIADVIRSAARSSALAAYARLWGTDVCTTAIALIAASEARSNRAARELAAAILSEAAAGEIEIALRDVGL
jgi:hypothetical protein